MAEGFMRAYSHDTVEAASAGLMPLNSVPLMTRKVMLEKNLPIDKQYPKGIELFRGQPFDVIVNMSGSALPGQLAGPVEEWVIADPYGRSEGIFRQVRDQIELRVMQLMLRLRNRPAVANAEAPKTVPGPVRPKLRTL